MESLLSFFGFSQDVNLTGKFADEHGDSLGSATVYLEKVSDSSMISYTISDRDGAFRLKGRTAKEVGYKLSNFAEKSSG